MVKRVDGYGAPPLGMYAPEPPCPRTDRPAPQFKWPSPSAAALPPERTVGGYRDAALTSEEFRMRVLEHELAETRKEVARLRSLRGIAARWFLVGVAVNAASAILWMAFS